MAKLCETCHAAVLTLEQEQGRRYIRVDPQTGQILRYGVANCEPCHEAEKRSGAEEERESSPGNT